MKPVFVCYAREDAPAVTKLVTQLEHLQIKTWFAERDFQGLDIGESLEQAMNGCGTFLYCATRATTAKKRWSLLALEKNVAIRRAKDQGLRIVPIRIGRGGKVPKRLGRRALAHLPTQPDRKKRRLIRLAAVLRRESFASRVAPSLGAGLGRDLGV